MAAVSLSYRDMKEDRDDVRGITWMGTLRRVEIRALTASRWSMRFGNRKWSVGIDDEETLINTRYGVESNGERIHATTASKVGTLSLRKRVSSREGMALVYDQRVEITVQFKHPTGVFAGIFLPSNTIYQLNNRLFIPPNLLKSKPSKTSVLWEKCGKEKHRLTGLDQMRCCWWSYWRRSAAAEK